MRKLPSRFGMLLLVLLLVSVTLIGSGCLAVATPEPTKVMSVGIALARGGLGDRSFNDSAIAGIQRAHAEFNVRSRILEFSDTQQQIDNLRTLVEEQHDLVIGVGQENLGPIEVLAEEFPDQHFIILDGVPSTEFDNVTSVAFRELEGDFLVGALAGMLSQSGIVGFLGGADIEIIRRIENGWMQGVRYVNPEVRFVSLYAGGVNDFSGFANPEIGMELTANIFESGADVVYIAAGRTGLGAIEAAKQAKRLVITTSADQRWIAPETVVTSRTKNLDAVIYHLIQEFLDEGLGAGTRIFDFASGGIGLAPLDGRNLETSVSLVPRDVLERMQNLERQLLSGEIVLSLDSDQ